MAPQKGWTVCPSCECIVSVQQGRFGKHWREVGRRCSASATKVPEGIVVKETLAELK
jgi:hypothetical protein